MLHRDGSVLMSVTLDQLKVTYLGVVFSRVFTRASISGAKEILIGCSTWIESNVMEGKRCQIPQ